MTKPPPDNIINLAINEWRKVVAPVLIHLWKCEVHLVVNIGRAWGTFLKEVAQREEKDD